MHNNVSMYRVRCYRLPFLYVYWVHNTLFQLEAQLLTKEIKTNFHLLSYPKFEFPGLYGENAMELSIITKPIHIQPLGEFVYIKKRNHLSRIHMKVKKIQRPFNRM